MNDLEHRLVEFLEHKMPDQHPIGVENLHRAAAGNSRENWFFEIIHVSQGSAVRQELLLRRNRAISPIESDRLVEFRVLEALKEAPFRTPDVYWVDATGEWLERPGIIMEVCEGRYDRHVVARTDIPVNTRVRFAARYAEILGQLHAFNWKETQLGSCLPVPSSIAEAASWEVHRWMQQATAPGSEASPVLAATLHWLRENRPMGDRISLVHGDFRPGNSLVDDENVLVMLDWETAHLSDPMEDLGDYTLPTSHAWEHFVPGEYEAADFYKDYTAASGIAVDEAAVHYWRVVAALKRFGMVRGLASRAARDGSPSGGSDGSVPMFDVRRELLMATLIGLE